MILIFFFDVFYSIKSLKRLEDTNLKLKNSIQTSNDRINAALKDFNSHVQTLTTMKKDLDHIFKRVK